MRRLIFLTLLLILVSMTACRSIFHADEQGKEVMSITPVPKNELSPLPAQYPRIARQPDAADFSRFRSSIPSFNPKSIDPFQVDLRSNNLFDVDARKSYDDLMYASFDSQTEWPPEDLMPKNFDWQLIMELGKNPGLGIRYLHDKGFTGQGIGIAIIDQTLLVDHQEYVDQLRLYEEAEDIQGGLLQTQMHGPAVASIAVGKTVGVAPDADLYYLATMMCHEGSYESIDFSCLAQSVYRVLEINKELPEDRKIRVISMSIGWDRENKGYDEIVRAVEEAKSTGLLVICSSVDEVHGFKFHGLERYSLNDPDQFSSYEPGLWWAEKFYEGDYENDRLLVPMDSRTTASPTGVDEYVFYRQGGWSWSIPYIAGVYALAVQAAPSITPDEFWALAMETGQTIELRHGWETLTFGPILDPVALIAALQSKY